MTCRFGLLSPLGRPSPTRSFAIPANVQVETFVAHEAVLPYVSAVITQCGLSTITKVLAAGLPMVCLPVLGDQPANAARIGAIGAGVRLAMDASASTIGGAVRRVLDDHAFRHAAQHFAATLATENPTQLTVAGLEELLP